MIKDNIVEITNKEYDFFCKSIVYIFTTSEVIFSSLCYFHFYVSFLKASRGCNEIINMGLLQLPCCFSPSTTSFSLCAFHFQHSFFLLMVILSVMYSFDPSFLIFQPRLT